MKRHKFFTWLKTWLQSMPLSPGPAQERIYDWDEAGEADSPAFRTLLPSLRKRPAPHAKFFPRLGRGENSAKKRFSSASAERASLKDWRRRTMAEEAPRQSLNTLQPNDRQTALQLPRRKQMPFPAQSRRRLSKAPPMKAKVRRGFGTEAIESILSKNRPTPVRDFIESQRPSLLTLIEVERAMAHQESVPDFEPRLDSPKAKGEGRPSPVAWSSHWLHLGPRLAVDLAPLNHEGPHSHHS